jgi:hypothetical protein
MWSHAKVRKMAVGEGMCSDMTCGLSFHCLLLTSNEGICMLQICVQDSAKLWTMPAIAEITHQQFLHGWWFYKAKVPRIYGGCCPFWEAVCKGHSSGTHLSVLKVHVYLKTYDSRSTSWSLPWLRRNFYLMRGFNSVLGVAFFWSADYGYWWFDLGCTFVGLWGTSSKIERCWKSSSPGAMTFFCASWRSSLLLVLLWFDWQNSLIWQFSIQEIVLCLDTKIISTEKFSVLIEIFFPVAWFCLYGLVSVLFWVGFSLYNGCSWLLACFIRSEISVS